jgi:hypothetical protein
MLYLRHLRDLRFLMGVSEPGRPKPTPSTAARILLFKES